MNFNIPDDKKIRVILDTDLKNEVDDQFALAHAMLTESFDIRAVIPAHFGTSKSETSQKDSYLGDSPAVGLMMFDGCGEWAEIPAPEFDPDMKYVHGKNHKAVRVYKNIDPRFILEDFYAKLRSAYM